VEALWPSGIHHGDVQVSEIDIDTESEIASVRQRVRELAKEYGFDQFAAAALTTAASELSRNVWVHAHGGIARITVLRRGNRVGLELEFTDHGPGIADVSRALQGGFSTSKSLGLGLSGTKRLVDEFSIETEPGRGTKVVIHKWKKQF
jgi:serine/threonine-protein kinase RsbT